MPSIRLRMEVRNTEAVKAFVRARTRAQHQAILDISLDEAREVRKLARELCPVLTEFSKKRVRLTFYRGGLSWTVGFAREDFVGVVNPKTKQVVTSFYIVFRIKGTRFMAGYDFLTIALERRRAIMVARLREVTAGTLAPVFQTTGI